MRNTTHFQRKYEFLVSEKPQILFYQVPKIGTLQMFLKLSGYPILSSKPYKSLLKLSSCLLERLFVL